MRSKRIVINDNITLNNFPFDLSTELGLITSQVLDFVKLDHINGFV